MAKRSALLIRFHAALALLVLSGASLGVKAIGFGHSGGHGGGGHSGGGHAGGGHTGGGGHIGSGSSSGGHTSTSGASYGGHNGSAGASGTAGGHGYAPAGGGVHITGSSATHVGINPPSSSAPSTGHVGSSPNMHTQSSGSPAGNPSRSGDQAISRFPSGSSSLGNNASGTKNLAATKAWTPAAPPRRVQADFNIKAMPQPEISKRYQPIGQEFKATAAPRSESGQWSPVRSINATKAEVPTRPVTREFYAARDGFPLNQGFAPAGARIHKHVVGEKIGRRGDGWGRFSTPELNPKNGTHSLDPKTERKPMQQYEVTKEHYSVKGLVAPAWSQPGGGTQHVHSVPLNDLVINGYLRKIPIGSRSSKSVANQQSMVR
jgi:hypothetical protein